MARKNDSFLFGSSDGWIRFAALTLTIALICTASIQYIDKPVALWIPAHISPDWRAVFNFITDLGKAEGYVLAALLAWGLGAFFARHYRGQAIEDFYRALSRLGLFVISSLAFSGALIHILKISLGRARPGMLLRHDVFGFDLFAFDTKLNSFPSGHSQTIWAVMIPLALVFPRARLWFLSFAALVAASRIMVSAHFPADVIAGSYIAICSALFLHQRWFEGLTVPSPRSLTAPTQEAST